MRQLILIGKNFENVCFFLKGILQKNWGQNLQSQLDCVNKDLFLSLCYSWTHGIVVHVRRNKVFYLVETLFLNFVFCYTEVFRIHARLNDAAGSVRSFTGKRSSYCYLIGREITSNVLRYVTRLHFCLYVKRPAFHFLICYVLKEYVWHCTRFWAGIWIHFQNVGGFHWCQCLGFFFLSFKM